jgi:tRNA pseudouridine55 synthase
MEGGGSDGVLLRAKPAGVTSHDVVADVRRALPRGTKVGHAGTLDPFATGLLLILVGRATRAQRFLMELPKTYRAVARLGWTSDTGDRDGELVQTGRTPDALEIPTGEQLQRPPAYSAVKVGGRRAYDLARAGETPELEPRRITVHRSELLWHEGDRAAFEIECSTGTYIRTLLTDLVDAYCEELERTAIGPFRLEDALPAGAETAPGAEAARGAAGAEATRGAAGAAVTPAACAEAALAGLVPLREALSFMPERVLSGEEAVAVGHGRRVAAHEGVTGHVRLMHEGEIVAIGEPRAGELQPVVVFAPA